MPKEKIKSLRKNYIKRLALPPTIVVSERVTATTNTDIDPALPLPMSYAAAAKPVLKSQKSAVHFSSYSPNNSSSSQAPSESVFNATLSSSLGNASWDIKIQDEHSHQEQEESATAVGTLPKTDYFSALCFAKESEPELIPAETAEASSLPNPKLLSSDIEDDSDQEDEDEIDKLMGNTIGLTKSEINYFKYPIFYLSVEFDSSLPSQKKQIKEGLDTLLIRNPVYRAQTPLVIQDKNHKLLVYGYDLKTNTIMVELENIDILNTAVGFTKEIKILKISSLRFQLYDTFEKLGIVPFNEDEWSEINVISINNIECAPELAALIRRNPILESLIWSFVCRTSLQQFFNLYEDIRAQGMPYFVAGGMVAGLAGTYLGVTALKTPNVLWKQDQQSARIRFLWAFRNGLTVFIGSISIAIASDLSLHPSHGHNSSDLNTQLRFWFSIIAPPCIGGSLLCTWQTLSPFTKNQILNPFLERSVDVVFDLAFFDSVFGIFFKNVCGLPLNTSQMWSGTSTIIAIITKTLLSSYKKSLSQSPYTILLYFLGTTALAQQIKELVYPLPSTEVNHWNPYYGLLIGQNILMSLQLGISIYYIKKYYKKFLLNYQGDVEIESRIADHDLEKIQIERKERQDRKNSFKEIIAHNDLYFWPEKFIHTIDIHNTPKGLNNPLRDSIILVNLTTDTGKGWFACFIRNAEWVKSNNTLLKIRLESSIQFALNTTAKNRSLMINSLTMTANNGQIGIHKTNCLIMAAIMEEALLKAGLPFKREVQELLSNCNSPALRNGSISLSLVSGKLVSDADNKSNLIEPDGLKNPLLRFSSTSDLKQPTQDLESEPQNLVEPNSLRKKRMCCVIL